MLRVLHHAWAQEVRERTRREEAAELRAGVPTWEVEVRRASSLAQCLDRLAYMFMWKTWPSSPPNGDFLGAQQSVMTQQSSGQFLFTASSWGSHPPSGWQTC
jgi:hypothetical protein